MTLRAGCGYALPARLGDGRGLQPSRIGRGGKSGPRTEGGEALASGGARWFALWTHSHCEQLVRDQLTATGFSAYLPMIRTWSRRAGKQRLIPVRSEERRVGKECRARWSPSQYKRQRE